MPGRTIRIFLADGTPQGIRVAEVGMWTGIGLVCPRADLAKLNSRTQAHRTGVYILVGDALNATPGQRVYIGEGDDVWERLRAHDDDPAKDFWDWVVMFVSKDDNLTKAHGRWLEAKLVGEIKEAKRVELANGNSPPGGDLPEADVADMATFMENVRLLLPVLGLDALTVAEKLDGASDDLVLALSWEAVSAECVVRDGQFIVRKGSTARVKEVESLGEGYRDLRRKLRESGVLSLRNNDAFEFSIDYAFSSPSAAAAAVTGTGLNGRAHWKIKGSNQSYGDWQAQHTAALEP
jgi:hypothetical protein